MASKQYLRFLPGPVFGVIASPKAGAVFVQLHGHSGKYIATAACENIYIWDLRKGEKLMVLYGEKNAVSVLAASPAGSLLAAGYTDGDVRMFDLLTGECTVTFSGHKTAVTALAFDATGLRLASGSKDTDLIVWDVVTEAGMFRLTGHKGQVTKCQFLQERNILVSSSQDTLVKFWDLDTQHCFQTLVGHRSEVWDFVLLHDLYLVTGCSDSELRVWRLCYNHEEMDCMQKDAKRARLEEMSTGEQSEQLGESEGSSVLACHKVGSLLRAGRDRVSSLVMDTSHRVIVCHGSDSTVELFCMLEEDEVKKRVQKRQRKERKKAAAAGAAAAVSSVVAGDPVVGVRALQDEVRRLAVIKASGKVTGIDIFVDKKQEAKVLTLLGNNSVEVHTLDTVNKSAEPSQGPRLTMQGHRTEVRTLCFSSDNLAVLSASSESLKIWNRLTQSCIRTIPCGYALCSVFAPGDRHVIVGVKTGMLQIFDIAARTMLEQVDAHQGPVWSACLSPDQHGVVTGSADKTVKFWNFELITGENDAKQLSVLHTRTLQMSEDVLCVRCSHDRRFLAVALLDCTVKVFFVDTLKFFLSLYGHKLPVLCLDISSDSSLAVTGSADRNIKVWGLDFGDCHRSIFAHDNSVMGLQFVPGTHMFFSCGKDGRLNEWDADNFEKIITLEGHHGEVWSLAVSPDGKYVVSCGRDRSLRLWEKSDEPLVLEDEREMEREAEADKALATGDRIVPGEQGKEASMPSRRTVGTEKAAERMLEALQVYREYTALLQEDMEKNQGVQEKLPPPPRHPLMVAYKADTPDKYILEVIRRVKSSELEECLLILPLNEVLQLMLILHKLLVLGWEVELVCRCLFFLLRVHHRQIISSSRLLPVIDLLRTVTHKRVNSLRDLIGFNLSGLHFLQRQLEQQESVQLFLDATSRYKKMKKGKRRKEKAVQRAVLAL